MLVERVTRPYTTPMNKRLRKQIRMFVTNYGVRTFLICLWVTLLAVTYYQLNTVRTSFSSILFGFIEFMNTNAWGVLLYIGIFTFRPLFFFPALILLIMAGLIFGAATGILLAIVGTAVSASVAYWVGRFFNRSSEPEAVTSLRTWRKLIVTRPFEAAFLMHFSFLPFDAVNYFSGLTRMRFIPFILGTMLGNLPSIVSFVIIGASIDLNAFIREGFTLKAFNPWYFLIAFAIFLVSVGMTELIRAHIARVSKSDSDLTGPMA